MLQMEEVPPSGSKHGTLISDTRAHAQALLAFIYSSCSFHFIMNVSAPSWTRELCGVMAPPGGGVLK